MREKLWKASSFANGRQEQVYFVEQVKESLFMILYLQMDDQNEDYYVGEFDLDQQMSMQIPNFHQEQFYDQWGYAMKVEIGTHHTDKDDKEDSNKNIQNNFNSTLQSEEEDQGTAAQTSIIQVGIGTLLRIQKSKKGRPKETKNIGPLFKSETLSFLNMLAQFKILDKQAQSHINKFKQETSSSASFQFLLKNKLLKQKLTAYFESPQFLKKILSSERLVHSRKIQIIKNIHVFHKILRQVKQQDDN